MNTRWTTKPWTESIAVSTLEKATRPTHFPRTGAVKLWKTQKMNKTVRLVHARPKVREIHLLITKMRTRTFTPCGLKQPLIWLD